MQIPYRAGTPAELLQRLVDHPDRSSRTLCLDEGNDLDAQRIVGSRPATAVPKPG